MIWEIASVVSLPSNDTVFSTYYLLTTVRRPYRISRPVFHDDGLQLVWGVGGVVRVRAVAEVHRVDALIPWLPDRVPDP